MQFRKTAVAVAIAGIAAVTPQIASADTVLSGVVEIEVTGSEDGTDILDDDDVPTGVEEGDPAFGLGDALVGITTSHNIISGAEGYASVRIDSEGLSGSNFTSDNVYVGVRGSFGDVRFGEVPTASEYGQLANDIFDQTDSVNGGVSYTGVFGPIVLGTHFAPEANEDTVGIGARFNIAGFSVGLGAEERDDLNNASIGASYGIFGISLAAHFVTAEETDDLDREIVAVQAGYSIFGLSLGLTYQEQTTEQDGAGDLEEEAFRIDVGAGLGGGMSVNFRYNTGDDNTGVETNDDWRININKSF